MRVGCRARICDCVRRNHRARTVGHGEFGGVHMTNMHILIGITSIGALSALVSLTCDEVYEAALISVFTLAVVGAMYGA